MTEVKTQISEEKQITSAGAELKQAIEYLAERATTINRYSDKLSEALGKIDNAIYDIKISRDFTFTDTEPFYTTTTPETDREFATTEKGFLTIQDGRLKFKYFKTAGGYTQTEQWNVFQISRLERKAIIQSGRLPKFLAYVAEQLAIAEQEYKQVAEIAEKMANAIQ